MKVNRVVREMLVENLDDWLNKLYDDIHYWIKKISKAETVEDVMKHKQDLLLDYVNSIPLGWGYCYFCLLYNGYSCEEVLCEYGVVHGFCDSTNSDYATIQSLKRELKKEILNRYYRGEKYNIGKVRE